MIKCHEFGFSGVEQQPSVEHFFVDGFIAIGCFDYDRVEIVAFRIIRTNNISGCCFVPLVLSSERNGIGVIELKRIDTCSTSIKVNWAI